MFNVRWSKLFHDMWLYKARAALIVAAIAVGVTAVGVTTTAEMVLRRDLFASYVASAPADVVLTLPPFDKGLVKTVSRLPEVQVVAARRVVIAELQVGPERWMSLELHALSDFAALATNRLTFDPGAILPPPDGSLLLERSVLNAPDVEISRVVRVRTADGRLHILEVAGLVNDLTPFPTSMNMTALAYLTPDTLANLLPDQPRDDNHLSILIASDNADHIQTWPTRAEVERVVARVAETTASFGYPVLQVTIPQPGKPILADNTNAVLIILGLLGALSLVLSNVLIVNVTFGLIGQQVPQIGIIKSLGGRTLQITRLYLSMVLLFGLIAALPAVPLGIWGASILTDVFAVGLDFDIRSFGLPLRTLLLQGFSALLAPTLVALFPILNGARITVRQAVQRTGLAEGNAWGSRLLARIQGLPPLLNLALRNVFRKWARMTLTLSALALGGAMFISVLGVRQSLLNTMVVFQRVNNYDVEVHLTQLYPRTRLEREAFRVPGVVAVESRDIASARGLWDNVRESSSFPLIGVLPETTMTQAFVVEGRWLRPGEVNGLIINADVVELLGSPAVGDDIVLKVGDDERTWHLVGIIGRTFTPHAFVTRTDFERKIGRIAYANQLVIQTAQHTPAFQALVERQLKEHFKQAGMPVSYTWISEPGKQALITQLDTVVVILLVMASLAALVGGLGLASSLGLNVLERTREIGILRSLGAQNHVIRRMVISEGVTTTLVSFIFALPLSAPISLVLGRGIGQVLLMYPLPYTFSWPAVLLWLGIVLSIAILASLFPANHAAALTIRETLAYVG